MNPGSKMGSMEGYSGLLPFVWKRVRKYRFRDTYQQMNRRYYPRSRRRAIKSTRLGKRSWGLKIPKLRICIVSPASFCKTLKDAYMRMVMRLTGKNNPSRLAFGSYNSSSTKSSGRRLEHSSSGSSVIYLDYLLKEGSLSSAPGYTKW
ncbi:hypothetical protein Mapa_012268 [Marchantia paleacea]|nr:hypothetical protein Mapa_012268 [Marchantia paleacea]